MDKAISILCTISLMVTPVFSKRHQDEQNIMAYRSKRSSVSCCFVDIFCYTTCYYDGGHHLRALAPDRLRVHNPETRRHRHHHRHRHGNAASYRVKRASADNAFWKKLRKSFHDKGEGKMDMKDYLTHR